MKKYGRVEMNGKLHAPTYLLFEGNYLNIQRQAAEYTSQRVRYGKKKKLIP
jgi:hypothetical protein